MSRGRRANPVVIGAFVLGAVALAATVVIVWGSGKFFRQTQSAVCYFTGSVNGLNVGAPVKFRGVPIGAVSDIRYRMSEEFATTPEDIRIPVWIEIDLARLTEFRGGSRVVFDRKRLDDFVAHGLRAQLQTESFVTGVLYVGLDFLHDVPIVLVHPEREDILEIPTMPTVLERAAQTVTQLLSRLDKLDLERLVTSITDAVEGVNQLVRSPQVDQTLTAARDALVSIHELSATVQPGVKPLLKNLDATTADARASLQHVDATLRDLRTLLGTEAPLAVELTQALIDLGEAARSVSELANYLERKPDALLTGRPGS